MIHWLNLNCDLAMLHFPTKVLVKQVRFRSNSRNTLSVRNLRLAYSDTNIKFALKPVCDNF